MDARAFCSKRRWEPGVSCLLSSAADPLVTRAEVQALPQAGIRPWGKECGKLELKSWEWLWCKLGAGVVGKRS